MNQEKNPKCPDGHGEMVPAMGEVKKGEFTFVWGRGGFKGITGTTPFVGGIYIEQQKEGRIYGTAHWPEMTYSLP